MDDSPFERGPSNLLTHHVRGQGSRRVTQPGKDQTRNSSPRKNGASPQRKEAAVTAGALNASSGEQDKRAERGLIGRGGGRQRHSAVCPSDQPISARGESGDAQTRLPAFDLRRGPATGVLAPKNPMG
ncbi:hypothetical protein Nepgr_002037 [Nepenthes gracilis]|uniref:Uncharacterized protein n=1 Tax=Nepenthes gracilis TaxID=150966 RepID=A0AAD3RY19_NEPGR|nr:hypothetical protein Nepgr_002037 [Nepenthes gracilis]